MNECLRCKSGNVVAGKIGESGGSGSDAVFKPDRKLRFWAFTLSGGTACRGEAFACLDCGLVWSFLSAKELRDFITEKCEKPEPDAQQQSTSPLHHPR